MPLYNHCKPTIAHYRINRNWPASTLSFGRDNINEFFYISSLRQWSTTSYQFVGNLSIQWSKGVGGRSTNTNCLHVTRQKSGYSRKQTIFTKWFNNGDNLSHRHQLHRVRYGDLQLLNRRQVIYGELSFHLQVLDRCHSAVKYHVLAQLLGGDDSQHSSLHAVTRISSSIWRLNSGVSQTRDYNGFNDEQSVATQLPWHNFNRELRSGLECQRVCCLPSHITFDAGLTFVDSN